MNNRSDTVHNAGAAAPEREATHHADGESGEHACEFCSPDPQIMPLPRSGAVRTSPRRPTDDADRAVGEPLT